MPTRLLSLSAVFVAASCQSTSAPLPSTPVGPTDDVVVAAPASPADGEVSLSAADDWRALLIHAADSGVWYLHVDKVVPAYGQNEVLAADDKGRLVVLSVYSGKWTATAVTPDGQWLAPTRPADVDPRLPGEEIYVGGKGGSVHRVVRREQPFGRWTLESVEIGHAAGEEFHAVLAADLDPATAGDELLAFGITGACYRLQPAAAAPDGGSTFAMQRAAMLPGRVRDTAVVPARDGGAPWFFGASRSGDLLAMRLQGEQLRVEVVAHEDSGLGRIARRPPANDGSEVLYVTRDDGVLLRFAQPQADAPWQRTAIFAGDQGLRGVAAGRFFADGREAVAVYGYGRKVQLVSRTDRSWEVATVFHSAQQGHWLAVGELDGRNGTDELVASGFDGKVVLLARPAGYGLDGAAVPAELRRGVTAAPAASR